MDLVKASGFKGYIGIEFEGKPSEEEGIKNQSVAPKVSVVN